MSSTRPPRPRALTHLVGVLCAGRLADAQAAEAWSDLRALDGDGWLALDDAVRRQSAVPGLRAVGNDDTPSSHRVKLVTASMSPDGHAREAALSGLTALDDVVVARAVALRMLDHVPQVRRRALEAVDGQVLQHADAMLEVLLAAGARLQAAAALAAFEERAADRWGESSLAGRWLASRRRRVRRYGWQLAEARSEVTCEQALAAALGDEDPFIADQGCAWMLAHADPSHLVALLDSPHARTREVGVAATPDSLLDDAALWARWSDRSSRVRAAARVRLARRGPELVARARNVLSAPESASGRDLVAALETVEELGEREDADLCATGLLSPRAAVRVAATSAVARRAPEDVTRVQRLLLDPSARVAGLVARCLVRAGEYEVPEEAWTSTQPWTRSAAWRVARARGGWHRVEADLRAAAGADERLAEAGREGIQAWLVQGASTTWQRLDEGQPERIAGLLESSGLSEQRRRVVAFHAGVRRRPEPCPQSGSSAPGSSAPGRPTLGPLAAAWWRARRLWGND